MKSDNRRFGRFTITGIDWLRHGGPEGFLWVFEGFVPMWIERGFNMDTTCYYGWHAGFEPVSEGYEAPEYVPERIDGKTVWRRA